MLESKGGRPLGSAKVSSSLGTIWGHSDPVVQIHTLAGVQRWADGGGEGRLDGASPKARLLRDEQREAESSADYSGGIKMTTAS